VFAADLNGDGKPDLIVANNGADSASVLVNTTPPGAPTASFAPQQTLVAGTSPQFIGAGDLNGDGRPDVVVSNRDDGTISVLLNTTTANGAGTPGFADQQTFAVGTFPRSTALADLNGDGRTDLITGNANDNTLSILFNSTAPGASTPSFADQQLVDTGTYPIAVAVADLNGDGKPDLIAANNSDNTVSLLLNQTAPGAALPSFAAQQTFATGIGPLFVVACDLNGDGRPDLAVANRDAGSVSVLLNATAPGATTLAFTPQQAFATGNFPRYVACTDLNGDGTPDLISANESGGISVLINMTPRGAIVPGFAPQQPFATGAFSIAVTAADVNGDGRPDLIVTNYQDLDVSVLLNTTPPGAAIVTFATQQTFPTGHGPRGVAAVDINGDGRPDLLVANYSDATISVLLNATPAGGPAPIFAAQQTCAVGALPYAVSVADFNGDGRPDLAAPNAGAGSVSVLLNAQYGALIDGGTATGTIVHDYIFSNGFD
jgi:elongation factor P hydroxylase